MPRPHLLHEALERPHRPRAFAGKRGSEPVEEELLGALHDVRRKVVEAASVPKTTVAGGMAPYAWSLNGELWPNVTPLMVAKGQRVAIEMVNHSMMPHPMHLHGHAFQVTSLNGAPLTGAVRDTVLSRLSRAEFDAFAAEHPESKWAHALE